MDIVLWIISFIIWGLVVIFMCLLVRENQNLKYEIIEKKLELVRLDRKIWRLKRKIKRNEEE